MRKNVFLCVFIFEVILDHSRQYLISLPVSDIPLKNYAKNFYNFLYYAYSEAYLLFCNEFKGVRIVVRLSARKVKSMGWVQIPA